MKRIRTAEPNQSFSHGPSGESFTSDDDGYVNVPDAVAAEMVSHGARYATEDETGELRVTEPEPGAFVVTTLDGTPVHAGSFTTRGTAVLMAQQLRPPSAAPPSPVAPEDRARAAETLSRASADDKHRTDEALDASHPGQARNFDPAKHPPSQPTATGELGTAPKPAEPSTHVEESKPAPAPTMPETAAPPATPAATPQP